MINMNDSNGVQSSFINNDDKCSSSSMNQCNQYYLKTQSTQESINMVDQLNNIDGAQAQALQAEQGPINKQQKISTYNLRDRNSEIVDQNQFKKSQNCTIQYHKSKSESEDRQQPIKNRTFSMSQSQIKQEDLKIEENSLDQDQSQSQNQIQQECEPYVTSLLDYFPELQEGIEDSQLDQFVQNLRSESISQKMGTVWVIRTGKKEDCTPNILHFSCKINQFKLCSSSFKLKKNPSTGLFQLFKEEKVHSHPRFTQKEIERKLKFVGQLRRTKRNKKYKTKKKSLDRQNNLQQQIESSSQTSNTSHNQDYQTEEKLQSLSQIQHRQNNDDIFQNLMEQQQYDLSQNPAMNSNSIENNINLVQSMKCISFQNDNEKYGQNMNQQEYQVYRQSVSYGHIPLDTQNQYQENNINFNFNNNQIYFQSENNIDQVSIKNQNQRINNNFNNQKHEQNYQQEYDQYYQQQQVNKNQYSSVQQQQVYEIHDNLNWHGQYQNSRIVEEEDGEDIFFSKDNKPRF